jgi:nucleoside phosphorylase
MRRVTLLVPRGAEAAAVRRARPHVRVVELPPGAAAARALPAFAADEAAIVVGLCGALRGLTVGDVAIYRRIADGAATLAPDPALAASLGALLPRAHAVGACVADHVVTTIAERHVLAERHDADVVDMEAGVLGRALAERGVPFAMVRVVSDDASRELPALERAIGQDGRLRPALIALAFLLQPRAAFAFVRDVQRALGTLSGVARTLGTR